MSVLIPSNPNVSYEFFDVENSCHRAVVGLLYCAGAVGMAVHGMLLQAHTLVGFAGSDAVKALLADQAMAVPLLDEWARHNLLDGCGVTTAEPQDFLPYMRPELDGAWLYRYYRGLDAEVQLEAPMLAIAFLPDGRIFTVNEPHYEDYINRYDGVRDTK